MKTAVITYNRNDGYKEKERFAIHLNTLLDTFDEVNYIDWNSEGKSLLYEVEDLVPKTGRIKHFVIPPSVHKMYTSLLPDLPFVMSSIPFNIALRRTDADWVVATTTDNIPPSKEELHKIINGSDGNTFYDWIWRNPDGEGGQDKAPWVDEVWQIVGVDLSLNDADNDQKYFIPY